MDGVGGGGQPRNLTYYSLEGDGTGQHCYPVVVGGILHDVGEILYEQSDRVEACQWVDR